MSAHREVPLSLDRPLGRRNSPIRLPSRYPVANEPATASVGASVIARTSSRAANSCCLGGRDLSTSPGTTGSAGRAGVIDNQHTVFRQPVQVKMSPVGG
jgi:hypothetical protein